MKKILIRAHMSPFDNWDAQSVLRDDKIGTNAGNMIFINSIMRALMTEDVQIDVFNTRRDLTDENVRRINACLLYTSLLLFNDGEGDRDERILRAVVSVSETAVSDQHLARRRRL